MSTSQTRFQMSPTSTKSELELSRLSKRRPVSKILCDEIFRKGLENMVLTYKLSMTETPLSHLSSEEKESISSSSSISIQNRHEEKSELIGNLIQYTNYSPELRLVTLKLAVTCRLIDHFGWYQPVLVHCSARTGPDHLVLTPISILFSKASATEMLVLSPGTVLSDQEVDRSALTVHMQLLTGDINCAITVNTPLCAAIASLRYGLIPLSKDYFLLGEVEYTEIGKLSSFKPEGRVIFFQNQGLCVIGSSVEELFYRLYHVLTACSVQAIALAAGADKVLPMRHDFQSLALDNRNIQIQEEAYHGHFENLARLITDTPLDVIADSTKHPKYVPQDSHYNSTHTNPFITPNMPCNTNPFLPLTSQSNGSGFCWYPQHREPTRKDVWDFTRNLFPSKDVWSFLPHFPLDSNPLTQDIYVGDKRTVSGRNLVISTQGLHLKGYADDLI